MEQNVEVEVQIAESAIDIINNDAESSKKMEKNFTLDTLKEGLKLANKLETYFINNDLSTERSMEFKRQLQCCLAPYYDLQNKLESKASYLQYLSGIQKIPIE
ncbi:hypothetical protein KM043_013300 [Ampulex compressa]|nr:hypothetical protein KM043_013300 [Ampulex compressa]